MNEDIKAAFHRRSQSRFKGLAEHAAKDTDYDLACVTDEFLQKYAELIVRRCMDVAKYHTPDTEELEYSWLIHDKIEKHFGLDT